MTVINPYPRMYIPQEKLYNAARNNQILMAFNAIDEGANPMADDCFFLKIVACNNYTAFMECFIMHFDKPFPQDNIVQMFLVALKTRNYGMADLIRKNVDRLLLGAQKNKNDLVARVY